MPAPTSQPNDSSFDRGSNQLPKGAGRQSSSANTGDFDTGFAKSLKSSLTNHQQEQRAISWQGSFDEYLDIVRQNPQVARNSYQRIFDMIIAEGTSEKIDNRTKIIHYNFFDDGARGGKEAIFGIDRSLMKIVKFFEAAAEGYGADKRLLVLHGPVGTAKSAIAGQIKRGLENYSRTDEGAMYTFGFRETPGSTIEWSPMNEDPLHLLPDADKNRFLDKVNNHPSLERPIILKGGLNPWSRFKLVEYLERCEGDIEKALEHVVVKRLVLSEQDRRGIGTFQPRDEKNLDSTELTGDVNYRKIAVYGSDSDPRAFNFDGEFIVSNRGCFECVEMLKLPKEFLYDFLTASQEGRIKPKKFSQIDIDVCILGHTNEPEYHRLLDDRLMEAIESRTLKIDVPYNTKISDEMRIYERDYKRASVRIHFAPHTLEMAAMFAVMTRLEQPKDGRLTLAAKAKLYDGSFLPGYTEESVAEMRKMGKREGMDGIEPRFIQNVLNEVLVNTSREDGVNPFMVLTAIEKLIPEHRLCRNDKQRETFSNILSQLRGEYVELIKTEVQRAIAADEGSVARLCENYIDNIKGYTQHQKVYNRVTGQPEEPNESLMRSIEEKLEPPVSEAAKRDFRSEIMNSIGALSLEGKRFDYTHNLRLRKALEKKLFEDQKDTIRLSQITQTTIDKETQEKIDIVKSRLIRDFGYNERSASDVLEYVGSIFARGA